MEILAKYSIDILMIGSLCLYIMNINKQHLKERREWREDIRQLHSETSGSIEALRDVVTDNTKALTDLNHTTHGMNIIVTSFLVNERDRMYGRSANAPS